MRSPFVLGDDTVFDRTFRRAIGAKSDILPRDGCTSRSHRGWRSGGGLPYGAVHAVFPAPRCPPSQLAEMRAAQQ
ncbi:Hypothetical protein MexAM1_META1p5178 [Methylorubrum extorquens AM1]|uniref:Uncharacterized protein n=1 Tax=Methylorubrum extorquens (strain ATCC 14718 / DSM 1338 / JCM 2805 / NCIMB 9133 / AM1) TaxID=272630 RepID=C5AUZ5_METEA|nr:Hypothetical protein MexAM1_META1p5178 [Methylorubrum extorquens AM1]